MAARAALCSVCTRGPILDHLRAGRFIVLADDEDREHEGDLLIAAQFMTAAPANQGQPAWKSYWEHTKRGS